MIAGALRADNKVVLPPLMGEDGSMEWWWWYYWVWVWLPVGTGTPNTIPRSHNGVWLAGTPGLTAPVYYYYGWNHTSMTHAICMSRKHWTALLLPAPPGWSLSAVLMLMW